MATLAPTPVAPAHLAVARLLEQAGERARTLGLPVLASLTVWTGRRDLLAIFAAAERLGEPRLFWEHREEGTPGRAIVGLGEAYRVTGGGSGRFAAAGAAWEQLLTDALIESAEGGPRWGAGPLLLGGFRFDPRAPRSTAWAAFPDALLILPRLTLVRLDGGACLLTLNAMIAPDADLQVEADALLALRGLSLDTAWAGSGGDAAGAGGDRFARIKGHLMVSGHDDAHAATDPLAAADVLPAGAWQGAVEQTARQIREGRYEKVVLARQVRLASSRPFEAAQALGLLRDRYPNAFLFAVGLPEGSGAEALFVGATPERLIRLEGDLLETSVLAGSARRGATEAEDEALGEALMASAKDRHEHQVVATMLREALAPLCSRLEIAVAPRLLRLANVQHLHTPVRGTLADGHSILDLVARLHPTPAVGGMPREAALEAIRKREAMDRGWYAAPVGWIDRHGQGEFAVALRSALLRNAAPVAGVTTATPDPDRGTLRGEDDAESEALLFAGCGIMGDSDPKREYAESALKLRTMLSALEG